MRDPTPPSLEIIPWLIERVARHAKLPPQSIDITTDFDSYGLDSLEVVNITVELEKLLGKRLPPSLLYEYPNINLLAHHLSVGIRK